MRVCSYIHSSLGRVCWLQSQWRGYKQKKAYQDRLAYLRSHRDEVVKVWVPGGLPQQGGMPVWHVPYTWAPPHSWAPCRSSPWPGCTKLESATEIASNISETT